MLTLQWDVSIPDIIPHGNPVGIDIGLTNFVATSNGLLIKKNEIFCAPQNASLNCCKSALLEKESGQIIGKGLRKKSHYCMNMLQTAEKIGIASCHIKSVMTRVWCLSKTLTWSDPQGRC
jgi:putative transposase